LRVTEVIKSRIIMFSNQKLLKMNPKVRMTGSWFGVMNLTIPACPTLPGGARMLADMAGGTMKNNTTQKLIRTMRK